MESTIRPNRGRHVKPAIALAATLGLFALCGGAKVVDRLSLNHLTIQVVPLTVLLVMGLVPAAALATLTVLNIRNMSLRADQGRLVSTEWTGRIVTLEHPASARLYPISSTYGPIGELMVLAEHPGDEAVVLVPRWWRPEELATLLHGLNLKIRNEPPIMLGELSRKYPRAHLPFSVRHPWVFSGGTTLFVIGYLGVMVWLDLRF
jgi:hypothetical protein